MQTGDFGLFIEIFAITDSALRVEMSEPCSHLNYPLSIIHLQSAIFHPHHKGVRAADERSGWKWLKATDINTSLNFYSEKEDLGVEVNSSLQQWENGLKWKVNFSNGKMAKWSRALSPGSVSRQNLRNKIPFSSDLSANYYSRRRLALENAE